MDSERPPCDLHLHSHYSDGAMSPEELVSYAGTIGLSAVSITDHDTIDGVEEALEAGRDSGIEVVTGIEFSVEEGEQSLHILGYLFDHRNLPLAESIRTLADARIGRARLMVHKLAEHGASIPFDEVLAEAGRGSVGRPHVAKVLYRRGLVASVNEAFVRYIADGAPCNVPKDVLPLERVVELIRTGGGVAVWAHPGWNIKREGLLDRLVGAGVKGVEAWHPNHTERITSEIVSAAGRYGLVCTGGSDFHFPELMQADIGEVTAPYESLLALRSAATQPHLT
jgi:predicted metal-dependent phosphoesterase TrpH